MNKIVLFISTLLFTINAKATNYYLKSGGTVTGLASWGMSTNGTGTAPASFTAANQIFNVRNNATVTLTAAWTVSGTGSGVTIGDGSTTCNFTIPATFNLTGSILNVSANATLTLKNNTLPTLTACVYDPASTVDFANSATTTIPLTNGFTNSGVYGNLTVSGTGANYNFVGAAGGATTYTIGTLNITTANTFEFNGCAAGATSYSFTITNYTQTNGTVEGAENNATDPGGNAHPINVYVYILGVFNKTSGILTDNSPNNISQFIFNSGGSQSFSISPTTAGTNTWWSFRVSNNSIINLNNALDLSGGFTSGSETYLIVDAGSTFNAGNNLISTNSSASTLTLLINGKLQTAVPAGLNGSTSTMLVSTNTPTITLGSASTIEYNSTSTQTITARTDYANLTVTNNLTKTLVGATTVAAAFTHTNGVVNLNGQTLALNGTQIFPTSLTNGSFTGSTTSNLIISGTGITNPLFFTSGSQTLNNFTLNSSAAQTLVLGTPITISGAFTHISALFSLNGNALTLNGAITFPTAVTNGSFTGSSTSVLNIGGTAAITNSMFMTQTNSFTNSLQDITLNRSGITLTLGNPLNLIGTLTPTLGTFASAGNLTLIASSPTVTARIATIGGSVTGNVTVQSYAAGGNTGWVLMGSAGITGRTFADWNNNFAITCASCPNGNYVGGQQFTSIYSYLETAGGLFGNTARYVALTNTTGAMTIGQGYWVYLGNGTTTSSDILYKVTGPVNQGDFTYNLTITNSGGGTNATDHGYNLLSNPYPSPISWTSLLNGNANVSNAIYVYNPDLNGYASYVAGVSSPAVGSGGIGDLIPSGQGFFIQATAATSLVAKETYKAASSQQLLRTSSATPMVFRLKASGNNMQNETVIYFDANATLNYENTYDALSLGVDAGFLGIVSSLNNTTYAINGLPALNKNFSIPIKATTGTTGSYQIAAADLQNLPSGACIMLHDNYMGYDWDLRKGAYNCTLTDTETVARFVLNITIDSTLSITSSFKNPTCASSANGYIIANAPSGSSYNYYWKDANNNIIKTSLNAGTTDTLKKLQVGIYHVDVNSAESCSNATNTFTLQGLSPSFIPSATTYSLTSNAATIAFNNTSTNATSYLWDFGDGTTSANLNATHQYTSAGNYIVSLTAYNQTCGDSSVYSQVITIDSASTTTGIKSFTAKENNIQIDRDAAGYYVQFNYTDKTNATISVQNLLGEKVTDDIQQGNVLSNKTYISLGNSANNVLIISVVTSAGEKIFRKVINY